MSTVTGKPKRSFKSLKVGVYVFGLIFLLAGAAVMGWASRSEVMKGFMASAVGAQSPRSVFRSNSLNILILGCDQDLYYGGKQVLKTAARSDMMLVARLDFDQNRISAISIPRDLRVRHKGGVHRINAMHVIGGPDLSKETVEKVLDIPIDRVVVLNFKAFMETVDMLGGVDVFIDHAMKYEDKAGGLFIDLEPGRQHLTGYEAMGYVRFRKGKNDSDYTRQKRQKELMLAIQDRVKTNPTIIPDLAEKSVEIMGNSFSGNELGSLVWFAQKVGPSNIKMDMVPVREVSKSPFMVAVEEEKLTSVLEDLGFKEPQVTRADRRERDGA